MPVLYALVALYITLWTAIPLYSNTSLPLDVLEGIAWGQAWQWGYYKHPPLPAWLLHMAFSAAGDAGVYALAAMNNGAALLCVYGLLRELTQRHRESALSALLLCGVYYYTWPTPEFNHNTLQLLLWPLCLWLFVRAMQRPAWCVPLALALAALLYTKYSGIVLLLLMLIYTAWRAPQLWRSVWFYGALLLGMACMVPHWVWLAQHNWAPLHYAAARSKTGWPWSFMLAQLANHAPLLLLWPFLPRVPAFTLPQRTFILFFGLMPVAVVVLGALLAHQAPRAMWGAPLFSLSGALLLMLRARWPHPHAPRYFVPVLCGLIAALPLFYGMAAKHNKRTSLPAQALAQQAQQLWQAQTRCPLQVVAGNIDTAGLLNSRLTPRPMVWIEHDFAKAPWLTPSMVAHYGYVAIDADYSLRVVPPLRDCGG